MKSIFVAVAVCYLVPAQGGFSYGDGSLQLMGVPDESHYSKLTYPKYDIVELGSAVKDSLPPAVVQITKQSIINVPQPYPIKVPVPHPVPIPVPKPFPVVETKLVKVPVPIEVPQAHSLSSAEGGSYGGHEVQQLDGGYGGGNEGYQHGGYGEADQSQNYGQIQQGWVPVQPSAQEH